MSRRGFSEGGPTGMTFVYLLQSELDPSRYYVGVSNDPERRLDEHNSGKSIHTNKFRPWKVAVTVGFSDASKATAFERYLKTGSGRAFAKRHF
jgi:putative endonuclease